MRWDRPDLKDQRRIRRGFLWFPITCYRRVPKKHDWTADSTIEYVKQTRWLERATWYQYFVKSTPRFFGFLPDWERWNHGSWEDCITCLGELCSCDSKEEPVGSWERK